MSIFFVWRKTKSDAVVCPRAFLDSFYVTKWYPPKTADFGLINGNSVCYDIFIRNNSYSDSHYILFLVRFDVSTMGLLPDKYNCGLRMRR